MSKQTSPIASFTFTPLTGVAPLAVTFDASSSSDPGGTITSYAWDFADGQTGTGVKVTHTFLTARTYPVKLTVTDSSGATGSTSVNVQVEKPHKAPIASFTFTPATGVVPLHVAFDGSASSDPDGTIVGYSWDFGDGQQGSGAKVSHTYSTPGTYTVTLNVTDNDGDMNSTTQTLTAKVNQPPTAVFTLTPTTGIVPLHVTCDASASSDPDDPIVGYAWDFGDGQQGSGVTATHTYATAGTYTVALTVTDSGGFSSSSTKAVTAKVNQPPTAAFTLTPMTGVAPLTVTCDASASSDPDDSIVGYAWDFGDGQHGSGVNVTHTYSTAGSYTLTLTVTDSGGLTGSISHTLSVSSGGPPPDPSKVAPPVDPTVATRLLDATAFLYTGPNPIQTGVAAGKIDLKRVAVLRGKVTDRSGAPLAGVTISILTHSEFGSTLTRSDGMFDLAVNGGGLLTVSYTKDGSLPAQRHIQVPWQDYAWLPDVVLIPLDSAVTPLDLTASVPIQVARGSAVSDSDGSRQATLLVPQGTQATLVLPNSSTQAIQKLSMRATEYTVGASGPATMPAELPPTSGYTYAVEYSADEALAAGATSVTFSQPLIHYSENFLNFSVGMAVPVGSYDKGKAAWIPSDNGQVLKILSITNGLADLDTTGNGTADNGTALGITTAERQSLAVLYSANQVLWRVPLTHFSAWDFNWAYSPPPDAVPPNQPDPTPDDPPDDQCTTPGSLIETQSQVLGETAIITGTPFRLHYRSYRVPDRKAAFSLKIPLSGASIPHNLKRIDLEVYVAGQRFTQSFPAAPNQSTAFVWDGNDAYGRRLQGAQPITVRIGYAYANVAYQSPAQRLRAFAVCLGIPLSGSVARAETILWKEWQSGIGAWDARAAGMGSWTLDVHHAYDPLSQVLYLGTGERRHAQKLRPIITTIAGNGVLPPGVSGDGGPAAAAQIWDAQGLALGPDGSFYIADDANHRIRRVGSDGIISTVVSGLAYPHGLALGPDGSLYIAETGGHRIRRLGSDGSLTTVAGTGTWGYSGDGGPASTAQLNSPQGVALGPDGSLYIADMGNFRVRRVGPDGIITTVAGQGDQAYSGEGGPATAARLYEPLSVAVATDGSLYIGELYRVRRVAPAFPGMSLVDFLIPSEDGSEVYFFNGAGRHLRTLDALTGAVRYQFTYDSAGHLASVTDGDGKVTTIEHDGSGNPTAIVGPYGQRTALALDANGYLASITDPAGESMQLTSTTDGLLTSLTDPRGNVYTFSYDAQGRLVKDADPAGGAKDLVRSDQSNGYTVSVVTALLQQSSYQVQQLSTGDERRVNACCGGLQTQVLQQTNGTTTVTAADGTVTTQVLGPDPRWGMLAPLAASRSITTPGGLTSTVTTTRTVTLTDPTNLFSLSGQTDTMSLNGQTYTRTYTAATKTVVSTTPTGRQVTSTLDTQGRVVQRQVAGLLPVSVVYDPQGRISTITVGSGTNTRTLSLGYSSDGYLGKVTDPLGYTTSYTRDGVGRILSQTQGDGSVIGYAYDASGNLTALTPPGRPSHTFTYTAVNLKASYTAPTVGSQNSQTQYTYDADRHLTQISCPDGQTVSFSYDSSGRLSTLSIARGQVSYSYDATKGVLTTITAPGGLGLSYSYDGMLPLKETWAGTVAGSVSRTYDNNFRVTSRSLNGGNTVSYQYDNDGLLTQGGNLTLSRNSHNGLLTGTSLGSITDSWSYNGFCEPVSYSAASSGTTLYLVQYTRDALGRITQKTEMIGGVTTTFGYSYDQVGRLTGVTTNGATTASYTYDGNGNRLSATDANGTVNGSYDAQDRLTQYGTATYAYSANGELQSKTVGGQTATYQYDALGNLTAVTLPSGMQITYLIDGRNRRIGKQINGTLVQGFLYQDGLRPIAELDGSNNLVSLFVYASRSNVPDYLIKGGTTYRILADHLGSPRLIVDPTGQIVQRLDYDAFGTIINDTNPGFQPFGFAGGLYDRDTMLVRFGARDYDAATGRWMAKDPIRFKGGDTNLYGYAANDSVNFIDPSGLLLGGCFDAGESYGANAAQYWADRSIDPSNRWYQTAFDDFMGSLASLWTPSTSDLTLLVLLIAVSANFFAGGGSTPAVQAEYDELNSEAERYIEELQNNGLKGEGYDEPVTLEPQPPRGGKPGSGNHEGGTGGQWF